MPVPPEGTAVSGPSHRRTRKMASVRTCNPEHRRVGCKIHRCAIRSVQIGRNTGGLLQQDPIVKLPRESLTVSLDKASPSSSLTLFRLDQKDSLVRESIDRTIGVAEWVLLDFRPTDRGHGQEAE